MYGVVGKTTHKQSSIHDRVEKHHICVLFVTYRYVKWYESVNAALVLSSFIPPKNLTIRAGVFGIYVKTILMMPNSVNKNNYMYIYIFIVYIYLFGFVTEFCCSPVEAA